MEPLKIQIEVKLADETLEAIKRIALATIFSKLTPAEQDELKEQAMSDDPEPEPAPEMDVEDMPEEIASPAPAPAEISNDDVVAKTREVVGKLKKAGKSSAIIRNEVFAKYGITQSIACPQEKREALIADLDALVAE